MHREDIVKWQKIKTGNINEFEKLFKKYYNSLCNFSYKIVENADIAEEIVQNLFVNLWFNKEKLEIKDLKNYLFKSTYNNSLQTKKFYKVRQDYINEQHKKNAENFNTEELNEFEKVYYDHEINERINELLNKMPDKRKKIFIMNKFEGLKYEEIAKILSISVKTVEANISKALKFLRKGLAKYVQ